MCLSFPTPTYWYEVDACHFEIVGGGRRDHLEQRTSFYFSDIVVANNSLSQPNPQPPLVTLRPANARTVTPPHGEALWCSHPIVEKRCAYTTSSGITPIRIILSCIYIFICTCWCRSQLLLLLLIHTFSVLSLQLKKLR